MTFAVCAAVYAGVVLWRMRETRRVFQRAAVCVAIAAALAGPFLVVDGIENGAARARGIDELREDLGSPGFRPSDVKAGKAYYGIGLRERGIGAAALFHRPWRWGLLTFRSLFGVYGTMNIISPTGVYGLQHLVTIVLLGWLLWWRRRPLQGNQRWFVGLCVAMLIATFAAAFWRAWVFDFQAQGRYVFAVIPISTLLLLDITEQQEDAGTWACGIALVAAGLCSLGFALPRLM